MNKKKGVIKKLYRYKIRIIIIAIIFFIGFIILININIVKRSESLIYDSIENVPNAQAALVLGARVYQGNVLSTMFQDRAETALRLYESGKVDKILISGDHNTQGYDEVNSAKHFFLVNRVPSEDIFLDHAGFDTYDSIYRARDVFKAESLIVVTQEFHLPRAVYIGDKLGIQVYGVKADQHIYSSIKRNELREVLARIKACYNILFNSKPYFLGLEIPLSGSGLKSWD